MNEIKRLKLNLQHFAEDDSNKTKKQKKQRKIVKTVMTKGFELTQSELDSQNIKL